MRSVRLNEPYGGPLQDLTVAPAERDELRRHAYTLPFLQLSLRSCFDLVLLATGGFSPLKGFLGRADYERVIAEMRLEDGTLFPVPIALPLPDDSSVAPGEEIALRDGRNVPVAVMHVREVFERSPRELLTLTDGDSADHPFATVMSTWGHRYVSGDLRVIEPPVPRWFRHLCRSPREVRDLLVARGRPEVVAFQTRNPLHRAHEELTKRAAAAVEGTLLLHPVIGPAMRDDIDPVTRARTYVAVLDRYYDQERTLLNLLPLAMRMMGPREVLLHAIIQRNYGATHLVVGRDHAGPGRNAAGQPIYPPLAAQEMMTRHAEEIGIEPLTFDPLVYSHRRRAFLPGPEVPASEATSISGTELRDEYLAMGKPIPEWFTRPETARILGETDPPTWQRGFCVWLTGLPAAGKSSIAELLEGHLVERGRTVTMLDGDAVRSHLSRGLGFSREDRDENVLRVGFVAREVVRHGGIAICALVSPFRSTRDRVRTRIGPRAFLEVFVDAPLQVCAQRDPKGLYARAREGKITDLTGVQQAYEPPEAPFLRLDTDRMEEEEACVALLDRMEAQGYLRPAVRR